MKRLLRPLLFLAALGLVGFFLTIAVRPDPEAVDLLPTETLALGVWENPARDWERWQASAIGRKVNDPNLAKLVGQLGGDEALAACSKALPAQAAFSSRMFIGKAAIALLPPRDRQPLTLATLASHLVVIVAESAGVPPPAQLEGVFGPVQSTATERYRGASLVTLTFQSGQALTVCRYRGLLICALDRNPVERCLDQALTRRGLARTGLRANQAYQQLAARASGQVEFFFYAHTATLWPLLPVLPVSQDLGPGLRPHHLALIQQTTGPADRLTLVAQIDREPLAAFIADHQLAPPQADPIGRRSLAGTQIHLWTNWFKAKTLWNLGLRMRDHEAGMLLSLLLQRLIDGTGVTEAEFFDVFGTQFGVFITEPPPPGQADQTLSCLYIEVRDQAKVAAMLHHLLSGLQVITVVTGGTEIRSVNMAGGLLQPAFALMDGHLVVADSVALIEELQRQGGIKSADGPTKSDRDRAGNLFVFARTKEVGKRLAALLAVLLRETADQDKVLAAETRLLLEHGLLPVLKDLQRVETVDFRGSVSGEEIVVEIDSASGTGGH